MITMGEKRAASKLYSLLYSGANIYNYNAGNKTKRGRYGYHHIEDPVIRYALIVRELKAFMKELENE